MRQLEPMFVKVGRPAWELNIETEGHVHIEIGMLGTNGYKITKPRRDNIEIALNDLGKPLLIDGRHRLAIAQILNIKKIPATVNILAESLAKKDLDKLANSRSDENLIKALADHTHRLTKQLRNKDIQSRLATAIRSAYPKKHYTAKQRR